MAKEIQFQVGSNRGPCVARAFRAWLLCLSTLLGIPGLDMRAAFASETDSNSPPLLLKQSVASNYAAIVFATYRDSLTAARKLESAVYSFINEPSEQKLRAARAAWREARVPYSQSEAFRFYDGPIDQIDGAVNAWPIDENYIDYVAENPDAGIINAVAKFPVLSRDLILSLNEKEGKKNVSTGFHAIEFLLWGQDRSAVGPGDRSWRDYANETKNSGRRREYLRLITELLVEQMETLARAWNEGGRNYRSEFIAHPDTALGKILKGLGALSGPEVAGERLTVPYETKEQEDEQSCFSDNTRDDIVNDAIGIRNVFFGWYASANGPEIHGPSMRELLQHVDPQFAVRLSAQIEATVAVAKKIPQPFDQAIVGANTAPSRIAIKRAIVAFQTESDMFAQAATVLSVKLEH